MSQSKTRRKPGRPAGRPQGAAREDLLKAARAVIGDQGLRQLSIKTVADKANVNTALAHYYFGNKEGLLDAVIDHMISELSPVIDGAADSDAPPEEQLGQIIRAYVSRMLADPSAGKFALEHLMMAPNTKTKRFVDAYIKPNTDVVKDVYATAPENARPPETEMMFTQITIVGAALFYDLFVPTAGKLFGVKKDSPELQNAFAAFLAERMTMRPE